MGKECWVGPATRSNPISRAFGLVAHPLKLAAYPPDDIGIDPLPAPTDTPGCGGVLQPCGTNASCSVMSSIARVQISSVSAAFDVPRKLCPPPLMTRRRLCSRAKLTVAATSAAALAATAYTLGADIQASAQPLICVAQGCSPMKNGLRRLRSRRRSVLRRDWRSPPCRLRARPAAAL